MAYKVVYYVNQFFGGIGGEEKADIPVTVKDGAVGPGLLFDKAGAGKWHVVGTVICGDNTMAENPDVAGREALEKIREMEPDFVIAGPAFNAGRYGVGCGRVCELVQEELGIPAVTGMFEENAGADVYRAKLYIIQTPETITETKMDEILKGMGDLAVSLKEGRDIDPAQVAGYIPRGVRKNRIEDETAAQRAIAMLLRKLSGQPFVTELPMQQFESVPAAAPIKDIKKARIALATTGGVIPKGNLDRMPSGRSEAWFKYNIKGVNDLTAEAYEANHTGYDTTWVNADPDRALPLDMARELESEKAFGSLHDDFYTLAGQGTYVDAARGIGESLADELKKERIDAVLLVST